MKQGIYNIESGIELENDAHVLVLPVQFCFFFFRIVRPWWRYAIGRCQYWNINRGIDFIMYSAAFSNIYFDFMYIYLSFVKKNKNNFVELLQILIFVLNSKLLNQSEKEFFSSQFARMFHFFFIHQHSYWCTWSRIQLGIIIRVQRIRTLF